MEKHTPHMKGFLYMYFIDRRRGSIIHVQKPFMQAGYLFGGEFLSSGMASPCAQVESLLMNKCVCFFSMDGSRMWLPMECVGCLCMILLAESPKKSRCCFSISNCPHHAPQKKKNLHHSVPEPCTRQFSINFHLEHLDAHYSHATVHHYLQKI